MKIILGSASEGRKIVMKELGLDFEIMPADIDEKAIRREKPEDLVMAIANAKADVLLTRIEEQVLLITSDQVVLYKNELREKPVDAKEAQKFLESYRDAPAETIGAVTVTNTKTGVRVSGIQKSTIYFKKLPDIFIDEYIKSEEVFKFAGGFAIQNNVWTPYVERVEGGFDSAVGLSKELVTDLIKQVS